MKKKGNRKILVVDDSATMRMLISVMIRKVLPDISVAEAGDGTEARQKLEIEEFDLILTDMRMPEMDGRGLIKWVREAKGSQTPIVVITTEGESSNIESIRSLGADEYLVKPIKSHELRDVIERLL